MRNQIGSKESGFTLIELLVVILIIGVLAAIAIPIFLNQRQAANEAALKSDVHSIQLTMENCVVKQQGGYPDMWINWGGGTALPPCFAGIKLSNSTRTHSFDFGQYYPASGVKIGEAYCIESANDAAGIAMYFRSDKGKASATQCQYQ